MAADLVGANNEYLISSGATPVTGAPFTVAASYNPASAGAQQAIVFVGDESVTGAFYILTHETNGSSKWFAIFGGGVAAQTLNAATLDTWSYFVGRENGTDRTVTLNGDLVNQGTQGTTKTATGVDTIAIGMSRDSSPAAPVDGRVQEIAVWNVILTDAEVVTHSLGYSALFIRRQSLVYLCRIVRLNGSDNAIDIIGGLSMVGSGDSTNVPATAPHNRIIMPRGLYVPPPLSIAAPAGGQPTMRRWGGIPGMINTGLGRSW